MPEADRKEPTPGRPYTRPKIAALCVVAIAFLAYLPTLDGEFVYDDERFIEENEAVHELSLSGTVSYFTDPKTVDEDGWKGIYRPLRTLEFAVDWAISGGRPWIFRLRSLLWHVLAAALVLALFRRLGGGPRGTVSGPAFFGAMLFAIHPVQTESVALVSSRGDLLCAVLFLGALLCHLDGRRAVAAGLLVVAVFAKETAVVFVGAAVLVDLYVRAKPAWRWYGVYGAIGAGFAALWFLLVAGGDPGEMAQSGNWWGGSYPMHLATMAKGFLEYARLLVLPVDLTVAWHVPARSTMDAGTIISIAAVLAISSAALFASRTSRFALLWFAVTIFPVSNLVVRLIIPTATRFLLLPSIGFCFAAGFVLARTRLAYLVLLCMLLLTYSRGLDWRSEDALWESELAVADSPAGLAWRSQLELIRAEDTGDPAEAEKVLETVDAFYRIYFEDIQFAVEGVPGAILVDRVTGGPMLLRKAKALLILGRNEEAYDAAMGAAGFGGLLEGRRVAEIALERIR